MALRLRNTYTKTVEEFQPLDPASKKVLFYSCGPTVYGFAHIGNFRTFLLADVLRRTLEQKGFSVRHVMNVTDVGHMTEDHLADASGEDKLSKAAREIGWDPRQVAAHFERAFVEDAKALRLKNFSPEEADRRELHPRATDYVAEMLAMIQTLIERGYAYSDSIGQVYYEVSKFPDYGHLSGKVLDDLDLGARIAVREEKRDPRDFALWKVDAKHLMKWDPHGPEGWQPGEYERLKALVPQGMSPHIKAGFPGWHIECSAMSRARLGDAIDLHTGGEDNIFPHHECEIAQSYGARTSDDGPPCFCRMWVHARHLMVNGAKMSKRDGTLIAARDLFDPRSRKREDLAAQLEAAGFAEARVPPSVLRFALIATPFAQPMNFTIDVLVQANASLDRIQSLYGRLPAEGHAAEASPEVREVVARATERWDEALDDDLNMARALAEVFGVVSVANKRELTPEDGAALRAFFDRCDEVLAVLDRAVRGGSFTHDELAAMPAGTELPALVAPLAPADVPRVLAARLAARREKNYARADEIRRALLAAGIELEDVPAGVRWRYR